MSKFSKGIGFLLIGLLTTFLAVNGAPIYKWVDDAGRTHFTDNPANIPLEEENYEKRNFKQPLLSTNSAVKNSNDISRGRNIWNSTCNNCHYLRAEAEEGSALRALPNKILDPDISLEEITSSLKASLELRSADMDDIKLSDAEIKAVGSYILKRTSQQ